MNKKISAFAKVIAVAICVAMILATLCACGLFGNAATELDKAFHTRCYYIRKRSCKLGRNRKCDGLRV